MFGRVISKLGIAHILVYHFKIILSRSLHDQEI